MPPSPTATKRPFPWVTPWSQLAVPEVRGVHVTPSGEVRMAPSSPTATKSPFPWATAWRLLPLPKVCRVHVTPGGEGPLFRR